MGEPACPCPPPPPSTHTLPASAPGSGRSPAPEGVSSCRRWSRASVTTHRAAPLSPRGRAPWALLTSAGEWTGSPSLPTPGKLTRFLFTDRIDQAGTRPVQLLLRPSTWPVMEAPMGSREQRSLHSQEVSAGSAAASPPRQGQLILHEAQRGATARTPTGVQGSLHQKTPTVLAHPRATLRAGPHPATVSCSRLP